MSSNGEPPPDKIIDVQIVVAEAVVIGPQDKVLLRINSQTLPKELGDALAHALKQFIGFDRVVVLYAPPSSIEITNIKPMKGGL